MLKKSTVQWRAWSKDVYEQLIKLNPNHLEFYAGKKYIEYLIPPLR
jgi:hypothetical protein